MKLERGRGESVESVKEVRERIQARKSVKGERGGG
jgi:hypothetical protein